MRVVKFENEVYKAVRPQFLVYLESQEEKEFFWTNYTQATLQQTYDRKKVFMLVIHEKNVGDHVNRNMRPYVTKRIEDDGLIIVTSSATVSQTRSVVRR